MLSAYKDQDWLERMCRWATHQQKNRFMYFLLLETLVMGYIVWVF